MGGPVQGASPGNHGRRSSHCIESNPTTGMGTNVAGVQGPGANAPAGMPPGLAGSGVMPGTAVPPAGIGTGGMGGHGPAGQLAMVGPMSRPGEYSGIGTCLDKLGAALHGPDLITRSL